MSLQAISSFELAPGVTAGGNAPLFIAGPCVIESEAHALALALQLASWRREMRLNLVFKASFDKANRTSMKSYRGPGMKKGLEILAKVKRETGLCILTDVHLPDQAQECAKVADVLQVPAFLCRQTDLLAACARTGKAVNVKKGQFLSPWDMAHVVEKLVSSGCSKVLLTERGTSFGYNNLVVDMRSIEVMRGFGFPVIFDATHSVQLPGGAGGASGGQREFIRVLSRSAAAAGADGFFMEVHEAPERALSDGPNALPLQDFPGLCKVLQAFHRLAREGSHEPRDRAPRP
ncbi:MAG: 3-deoxy-8-phosphooctulonate synthase [Acidobacteria bacterium]|jgi:2-dehydro-3-deoxyphosphooctonate aldolase (KDO 8-P synthase)|nr:3-deoxy-8-phosphooctulonate synthase [Acidobacteriota bacterium]